MLPEERLTCQYRAECSLWGFSGTYQSQNKLFAPSRNGGLHPKQSGPLRKPVAGTLFVTKLHQREFLSKDDGTFRFVDKCGLYFLSTDEVVDEDDPYKDFPIPDDLDW